MLPRRTATGLGRLGLIALTVVCVGCTSRGSLGLQEGHSWLNLGPWRSSCGFEQPCADNCSPEAATALRQSWPSTPYALRSASLLDGMSEPILGRVVADELPAHVRMLTRQEVRTLAAAAAPVAAQLRQHGQWLSSQGQETLGYVVLVQAQYEEMQHQRVAEEAWLNLGRVHCQTTVVDQGLDYLGDLESAVQRFRLAGIDTPVRPDELPRQQWVVQESVVELAYNQARLHDALESLLQLAPTGEPLWAVVTATSVVVPAGPEEAVTQALGQRADLRAWRQLAAQPEAVPNEAWSALHPWLATGLPTVPVQWWMCHLKREVEERAESEQRHRRDLLRESIATQEEKLAVEVRGHYQVLRRISDQLELKVRQRDLLRQAREQVEAVEMEQVDVRRNLEDAQAELRLTAQIIDLLFDQEIEFMRLSYTLGSL